MICPRCATTQLANTLFCDQCGEELQAGEPSSTAMPHMVLRLEMLDSKRTLSLPDLPELVLGRAGGSTPEAIPEVSLETYGGREGGVSRRHARLSRRGAQLYLEDLGSTNGTFVNERRLLPGQPLRIYPGDVVRLGLLRFTFAISTV